ncbi:MAG: hypothetical protein ACRDTA_15160 [Pseudonocardiaceae bacterium]
MSTRCGAMRTTSGTCSRYADVVRVISDSQVFSSDVSRVVPAAQRFSAGNLLQTDPPRHHQLRRLVGAAFSPKVVTGLALRIAEVTHELLGLPASDRELFGIWADRLLTPRRGRPERPRAHPKVDEATAELLAYLQEHCRDRRGHPRDDLISKLATVEADGQRLTDEEVVNFSLVLLLAGHITTTALLGNTALCLLAFGHGIHFCIGQLLARVEGRIAVGVLLDRYAEMRVTPATPLDFFRQNAFAARSIPVTVRYP